MEMNKKAYIRIADTGMFFLVFVIVGVCIAIGVYVFYFHEIDVRYEEAKILSDKLFNAVEDNGVLNKRVLDKDFNILKQAGLEKKIIENNNYYFKLEIFENEGLVEDAEEPVRDVFIQGNNFFENWCGLDMKDKVRCFERELILDNYKIKILTASNQLGAGV